MNEEERSALRKEYVASNWMSQSDFENYTLHGGPDPLPETIGMVWREQERRKQMKSARGVRRG